MGILKVVCVWCDSLHDCGLIIWGKLTYYWIYIWYFIQLNQLISLFIFLMHLQWNN